MYWIVIWIVCRLVAHMDGLENIIFQQASQMTDQAQKIAEQEKVNTKQAQEFAVQKAALLVCWHQRKHIFETFKTTGSIVWKNITFFQDQAQKISNQEEVIQKLTQELGEEKLTNQEQNKIIKVCSSISIMLSYHTSETNGFCLPYIIKNCKTDFSDQVKNTNLVFGCWGLL